MKMLKKYLNPKTASQAALRFVALFAFAILAAGCSVSYTFNGSSIDYTKTKTIQIADFPIRASYVWGPMAAIFNGELKDKFVNHTKLQLVKRNGDLKIEGQITQYQQRNKSVSAEGTSALIEDFERQFTSSKTYDSKLSLSSVQDDLVTQMTKDIVDQIFNATVANW